MYDFYISNNNEHGAIVNVNFDVLCIFYILSYAHNACHCVCKNRLFLFLLYMTLIAVLHQYQLFT